MRVGAESCTRRGGGCAGWATVTRESGRGRAAPRTAARDGVSVALRRRAGQRERCPPAVCFVPLPSVRGVDRAMVTRDGCGKPARHSGPAHDGSVKRAPPEHGTRETCHRTGSLQAPVWSSFRSAYCYCYRLGTVQLGHGGFGPVTVDLFFYFSNIFKSLQIQKSV
jgi:hypothetical protein